MSNFVSTILDNIESILAVLAALGLIYRYRAEIAALGTKELSLADQLQNGMLDQAIESIKSCNAEVEQLYVRLVECRTSKADYITKYDKIEQILALTRRELRKYNADNEVLNMDV